MLRRVFLASAVTAIAGLSMAVVIGMLLFKWSIRINLSQFFQIMGVFLLLIVSGLVISVLRHLDAGAIAWSQINSSVADICGLSNTSCILGPQVWDLSGILPDRQFPGILLKTIFGYTQKLYLLQAFGYLLFWAIVGSLYFPRISHKTLEKRGQKLPKCILHKHPSS